MFKLCRVLILTCLLATTAAPLVEAHPAFLAGTTYYVSSSGGNDSNNGLTEGAPFANVSKVNSLNLQPGDRVLFKCGDVWRADPLYITRSGTAGQPITFSSYPAGCANQPSLSGAQPIAGWTLYSGNVYVANLNAGANAGKFGYGLNQLFRNGTRLLLGRWPNLNAGDGGYSIIDSASGTQFVDAQLPSSVNWAGAIVHVKSIRWSILNRQVTGSSGTTLNLGANTSCWDGCAGWGYFLNNHLATLDQDGEWYYNSSTQQVYLYSTSGVPANGTVEGSVILKTGGDFGRYWGGINLGADLAANGPAYVTVNNLNVSRWWRDGIALPVNFANTEPHDLVIQNNTIQDIDGIGLRLATWVYAPTDGRPDGWRGGYSLTVSDNLIERANWKGIDLYSRNSTFSNNTLRDIGRIEYLGAAGMGCELDEGDASGGICTEDGVGIRVKIDKAADSGNTNTFSGNRLERIGHSGFDVFGYGNTFYRNVVVQACYSKGDCGGMGTFGDGDLGSTPVHDLTFSENIIVDTLGNTDGCSTSFKELFGFGLYIDNYSRNINVTGNTIINTTVHGILFQNSTGSVTNNTLYNNAYTGIGAQMYLGDSPAAISAHTGNILFGLVSAANTLAIGTGSLGTSNNNYFFNPYQTTHIYANGDKNLAQWQAYSGKDASSKAQWYTQPAGQAPRSRIFYNDTAAPQTFDLGYTYYFDLDQKPVFGSLTLQPYQSKILINSGETADLDVSMALLSSTDTAPGAPVTYTVTVRNAGTLTTTLTTLTNTLPAEIINPAWQASSGAVTLKAGSRYVWNLPDLQQNAAVVITVTGTFTPTLTPGQPILLWAQAGTPVPETPTSNNLASLLLGDWLEIYLPSIRR